MCSREGSTGSSSGGEQGSLSHPGRQAAPALAAHGELTLGEAQATRAAEEGGRLSQAWPCPQGRSRQPGVGGPRLSPPLGCPGTPRGGSTLEVRACCLLVSGSHIFQAPLSLTWRTGTDLPLRACGEASQGSAATLHGSLKTVLSSGEVTGLDGAHSWQFRAGRMWSGEGGGDTAQPAGSAQSQMSQPDPPRTRHLL